jgi:hypothetical protein
MVPGQGIDLAWLVGIVATETAIVGIGAVSCIILGVKAIADVRASAKLD